MEKTTMITVDGVGVRVDELPVEFRERVKTLDAFRERQAEYIIQLDMATSAVNMATIQLEQGIRKLRARATNTEVVGSK